MKIVSRPRAVGGSLMVTIPKQLVKEEGIRPGELLELEIGRPRKSFFGAARGVGSFTKEDELDAHD